MIVKALAILLLACLLTIGVQTWRVSHYKAQISSITLANEKAARKAAGLAVKASEAARKVEQLQAQAFAQIAKQNEQDKVDAQAKAARVVADLRNDTLRLQDRWATQCLAAKVAASAGWADEGRADREASAGRIVQAAIDADNQIRGLQAVLRAERQ